MLKMVIVCASRSYANDKWRFTVSVNWPFNKLAVPCNTVNFSYSKLRN